MDSCPGGLVVLYHAELPDPAGSCILEESKEHTSNASMTDQQMSATIYRGLFTDGEWEVIDRALGEYQDHLDDPDSEYSEEEQNYYSVQAKIHAIFKLTEKN